MNAAELILLVVVVALPMLLGAGAALLRRPWWWAAALAIALALVAMVAPTPEEGEPRLAAGDLGFVAFVAVVVALLVWMGNLVGRRLTGGRPA